MTRTKALLQSLPQLELLKVHSGTFKDIAALPASCKMIYTEDAHVHSKASREQIEEEEKRGVAAFATEYDFCRNVDAIKPLLDAWVDEAEKNDRLHGNQEYVEMEETNRKRKREK